MIKKMKQWRKYCSPQVSSQGSAVSSPTWDLPTGEVWRVRTVESHRLHVSPQVKTCPKNHRSLRLWVSDTQQSELDNHFHWSENTQKLKSGKDDYFSKAACRKELNLAHGGTSCCLQLSLGSQCQSQKVHVCKSFTLLKSRGRSSTLISLSFIIWLGLSDWPNFNPSPTQPNHLGDLVEKV